MQSQQRVQHKHDADMREAGYPYEADLWASSGESSGAQVAFPQTGVPPIGSMPMPPPHVRKRPTRAALEKCMFASLLATKPISAVSLVSPAQGQPSGYAMLYQWVSNAPDHCAKMYQTSRS